MKFLIILALTLANCFALPSKEVKPRNLVVPAGSPEGRITGGNNASENQFPYQVGLSLTDYNGNSFWCGGSLLNHEWVLTAAHCTKNIVEARVFLGATNLQSAEVEYIIPSFFFINHEDYDGHVQNDIALIRIPYTAFTGKIQPVKLPEMGGSSTSYAGENVIASGWGGTSDSDKRLPSHLQWARLNVLPNNVCERTFPINSAMLCTATINGVNICGGDSGGPLVLESSKVQIGLTSFGAKKCLESDPAVFTRLTSYLEWIYEHTRY